ncbi:anti-sigma factor family protein [Rosistilla oblonga]|uniref:anti-sigma factor family protein n=1 Tax=Rosistilla oblonga TaxID=2527990 RepID=UPI003A96968A
MNNEAREELLSAYLDNGLSADEQAHVEQLLQHDASVRQQLEALRKLQADVRASMPSDARLGTDFSDRVWTAVLAQADAEGLPDTHPIRLAQAREGRGNFKRHQRAWLGGLAALAASLTLIVAWNSSNPDIQPGSPHAAGGLAAVATPGTPDSSDPVEPSPIETAAPTAQPAVEAIASNDAATTPAAPAPAVTPPEAAETTAQPDKTTAPEERIAMAPAATARPAAAPGELVSPSAQPTNKLEFAVLLEVELTQRGRDLNELEYALETAGISNVQPQPMSRDHVGQLVQGKMIGTVNLDAPQAVEGDTQLLLLQGSAKRLDRFMLSLFNHQSVIKSVGFQMVMEPNLLTTISELSSVDPSAIRHADDKALAHHLTFGSAGGQAQMFPRAAQSSFFALTEESAKQMKWTPETPSDEGPDFQTQMLVLVRCPR